MNALINNAKSSSNAVFFDMDGTLVETDFANFLAYKKAIMLVLKRTNAIAYNPAQRVNHNNLREQIGEISDFEYKKIIQTKNKLNTEFLWATHVNQHVLDQLISLSKNSSAYLITNAQTDRALATIAFHGLTHYFCGILCKNDRPTNANKYLHALAHFDVEPRQTIVFENEQDEITKAQHSGICPTNIHYI